MPGLLDMSDEQNNGLLQFGLSMLGNSGPSSTPRSFGQIFGASGQQALASMDAAKDRKDKQADRELALQMHQAQLESLKRAALKDQRLQEFMMSKFGGGATSPQAIAALSQGAQAGSVGPTMANAARMDGIPPQGGQGQSQEFPMGLNDVTMLHAMGGPNLMDAYKFAKTPIKLEGGSFSQNPVTGAREFIPKADAGINLNADGSASPTPGYAAANASNKGAETYAIERAKAGFDPLSPSFVGSDGRPVGGTRLDYTGGGQPPPAMQPPRPISGQSPAGFPRISADQQTGADGERLRLLQGEIAKTSPADMPMLQREIAATQARIAVGNPFGSPRAPGTALQSEAEKAFQVGKVNQELEIDKQKKLDAQKALTGSGKLYEQLGAAIPMARDYLKNATGSGIGAAVDSGLSLFGKSTASSQAADQLETLGGWMTSNVPRMEGPQSNIDMAQYKTMAGTVGDRTKPAAARLAALDTLEKLQNKYREINVTAAADAGIAAPKKSIQDYGYSDQSAVIKDARNALMRNPSAKAAIIKRLEENGIFNHGLK